MPNTTISKLLDTCYQLPPSSRAQVLENSKELESVYREVALQGDSKVPENAEDDVDFHYTCFVKSGSNGRLYEMDGDRKGPIDRGALGVGDDVFCDAGLKIIKDFIQQEGGANLNFSLLALVRD